MRLISASEVAAQTPYDKLVEALRAGFQQDIATPVRHHHDPSSVSTLLLMPAWNKEWTGLKTVVVKTDNAALGLPTVQASYLLIDNATGETVCMMDGTELTRRRTAAASALAADYLARKDASHLVIVGAGALASHFAKAHSAVRPITKISIYNRTMAKAEIVAAELRRDGFNADAVSDLKAACATADVISCVTNSTVPILKGAWLRPGTHVDLAGAFKPSMRETDGDVLARSVVYVDTRDGALAEAGDLLQAAAEGKFDLKHVSGDLFELCRGIVRGRSSAEKITLFKSCGTALEDLSAAIMVHLQR